LKKNNLLHRRLLNNAEARITLASVFFEKIKLWLPYMRCMVYDIFKTIQL